MQATSHTEDMIGTHPEPQTTATDRLARCIEACLDTAQACLTCADACLAEDNVAELRRCISVDTDCADLCTATARLLSRQSPDALQLRVGLVMNCQLACEICAEECEKHQAMHEHCRVCAAACRQCASACAQMQAGLNHARHTSPGH